MSPYFFRRRLGVTTTILADLRDASVPILKDHQQELPPKVSVQAYPQGLSEPILWTVYVLFRKFSAQCIHKSKLSSWVAA